MIPVYRTRAINFGGREGNVKVVDSPLEFKMAKPAGTKQYTDNGANPEQLFAAGYAACFGSAVMHVVRVNHLKLDSFSVTVDITLGKEEDGGYRLAAEITLTVTGMDKEGADALIREAHQTCPYSRATMGNIDVKLNTVWINQSSIPEE
jgi:osmotically inducible protein OsmC